MKKVLASLLTAYVLTTDAQGPPAGATAVPATPAPVTTTTRIIDGVLQETTKKVTPAPNTPAPITAAPVTATPVVITPAPVTAAPVVITPAPVTAAPITAAPVIITPAPVTPAPVQTPAPTTPAPTTKAPTLNPYCPLNAGQQSGIQPLQFNENKVCFMPTEIASDYQGKLRCNNYACCQCAQINCGFDGYPCDTIQFGDSGAPGVQSINIRGAPENFVGSNPLQNIFGGGSWNNNGAQLECNGLDSCRGAFIRAEMLGTAQCSGDTGCTDAKILINDPIDGFNMQCNGMGACSRADIQINVGVAERASLPPGQECNPAYAGIRQLGTIEFNGMEAGAGTTITIRNEGCGTLLIQNFECMNQESCPGIAVNIAGANADKVVIENCDLVGVAPNNPNIATLVKACSAGQAFVGANPISPISPFPGNPQIGNPFGQIPQNPSPVFPQNPNQQFPPNPSVPTNPTQPNPVTPVNPVNPVNPTIPQNPAFNPGFAIRDPVGQSLICDSMVPTSPRYCIGQQKTVQISQNFVMECKFAGICNGMTLTLNGGADQYNNLLPVTRIDSLKFLGATSGVTIYVNNDFGAYGQPLRINDIRCEGPWTCQNLKIIAGPGVDIMSVNMDCQEPTSCGGCTIQQGNTVMPCDPFAAGMMPGAGAGGQMFQPNPYWQI